MNPDKSQTLTVTRTIVRVLQAACMLAPALLLASCVNPPPVDARGNAAECVYVKVTGSNLPVRQCSTAEERAALAAQEREGAEEVLDDLQDLQEFEGQNGTF